MIGASVVFIAALGAGIDCLVPAASAEAARADYLQLPGTNQIELVRFGPGEFVMGRPNASKASADRASREAAQPEHVVSLSRFWIGKYPVTVDQYCEFLNSVGFRAEFTENRALLEDFVELPAERFRSKPSRQGFPVRNVTPEGAAAFCEWVSTVSRRKCRLPTEAEWEYVAKGEQGRTYPWGETPSTADPYGCRVGENPSLRTPEGVEDLNGPVYQYCLDLYDSEFYKRSPSQDPVCTNGTWRVTRGGPMFRFTGKLQMPATWKRFHALRAHGLNGFRIAVEK